MQQQSNLYANDPNSNLLQVTQNSTISPPSSVNNANSILPPQQRTDRLQVNTFSYKFFYFHIRNKYVISQYKE